MATTTPVELRFQEFKPVNFDLEARSYRIVKAALSCLQTLINSIVPYLNQWVVAPLNYRIYGPVPAPAPKPVAPSLVDTTAAVQEGGRSWFSNPFKGWIF